MLTDQQALRLIENMRRNTRSADVASLCDWVLALVRRRAPAAADAGPKRKADRREYMKNFMRKRRAELRNQVR
jgi:hypothetical protein